MVGSDLSDLSDMSRLRPEAKPIKSYYDILN